MANVRVDGPIGRLYLGIAKGVGRLNLRTSQASKYADFRPGNVLLAERAIWSKDST